MINQLDMGFFSKDIIPEVTLVCGGRDFNNEELIFSTLDNLAISCIVHGGAGGADSIAGKWSIARSVPEIIVPAKWNMGKSAGVVRNGWMIKFIKIDHVVAFPGGRGTANMINISKKAGIRVTVVSDE